MMQAYECVVVLEPDLEEQAVEAEIEKIEKTVTAHGGSVDTKEVWERRQLAYPIRNREYGLYVVLVFTADNDLVAELNRQLRINERVLRSLTVLKDKHAPDFVRGGRGDNGPKRRGGRGDRGEGRGDSRGGDFRGEGRGEGRDRRRAYGDRG